jgi:hypothetical protein
MGTASGAPDTTYPHLPAVAGQLQGTLTDTIGYVTPSRQWIRVPRVTLAADSEAINNFGGPTAYCSGRFSVELCTPAADAMYRLVVYGRAYPVERATPLTNSGFTNFPATTVRMVAFGSIPVQAVVHLSLPLDSEGLPEAITARAVNDWWEFDKGPAAGKYDGRYQRVSDSTITGKVVVRLSDLKVDGVAVDVGSHCQTATPAKLTGHGTGYTINADEHMPSGSYDPRTGGSIIGTLDVPSFAGCGVAGDDLSPLISAMASGSDFPVKIEQGELGACWAPSPELIDPSTCREPLPLSFPSRDDQ